MFSSLDSPYAAFWRRLSYILYFSVPRAGICKRFSRLLVCLSYPYVRADARTNILLPLCPLYCSWPLLAMGKHQQDQDNGIDIMSVFGRRVHEPWSQRPSAADCANYGFEQTGICRR